MSGRQAKHFYDFGPFRVDVAEQVLLRDGQVVPLTPKAFDTLMVLVENSGHLLEKDELLKRLWPNTFVEEANLAHNISLLRKAFGENSEEHKYIQTVPRRGYRFVVAVKESREEQQPNAHEAAEPLGQAESVTNQQGRDKSQQGPSPTSETEKIFAYTSEDSRTVRRARRREMWLAALFVTAIVAAAILVYAWQRRWNLATAQPPIRSLALLPLENLSGDASQDYFADGLTEELNTELSKVSTLSVIARSSTRKYKGTPKSIPEIARELNVDAIVQGSVWQSGDKVRVNTQLVSASTGQNLWANSYERALRDVLSLQSEVARDIVNEIKIKLTPQEQKTLSRIRTIKPEAQDAYLKGLDYLNQGINAIPEEETKALCEKSFSYFQQAINIEPTYAEAYAALAGSYHWLASSDFPEYYPKSKEAALKSISLDETNPAAHGALAFVLWSYDWDAADSEKEYKRAIELDHNTGYRHGYALLLGSLGRYDEAIREMKLAEAIDPLDLLIKLQMGHIYADSHQYDRAIERFTSLFDLHPTYFPAREGLACVYSDKGMHEQALAEMHRYVELSKVNPATNINLAWVYAKAGRGKEALRIVEAFNKLPRSGLGSNMFGVAKVYAALGDKEQAYVWLEKAFAARGDSLQLLTVDAYWGNMRSDPRFQDLMRRRGLTP